MVTIAHLVKKAVRDNSFIVEGLSRGLISHPGLAEELQPEIEKELGKKVKLAAIVMAIRRFAEEIQTKTRKKIKLQGEIILKTNLIDINVVKSSQLLAKIKNLYGIVDFEKGNTLNIVLGNNEVAIITNEKFKDKVLTALKGEKIITKESDLVSLTLSFSTIDFFETPGMIFSTTRKLAWENINVFEVVSTMNELTFILKNKDSMKAYAVLQELFQN